MPKKASIIWISVLFVLFMTASMFVLPIDDDWFFLRYFPSATDWSANPYRWLGGNTLLPRDYWRPIEDMFLFALARHPQGFPYVNHALTVACCFAAALTAWRIALRAGAARWTSLAIIATMTVAATSMGAMLSIDSLTHVSATLTGLLSMWAYISLRGRTRTALWLIFGVAAMFCKESGVVYLLAGVLLGAITNPADTTLMKRLAAHRNTALTAIIVSGGYCAVYFWLHALNAAPESALCAGGSADSPTLASQLLTSQQSHHLTPATFIKNIFIIFAGAIWPVDTTAIYYPSMTSLAVTGLAGLGGPLLVAGAWHRADRERRHKTLLLLALTAAIGLPTLITRAGEISPFPTNLMLGVTLSVLAGKDTLHGLIPRVLATAFLTATFITDGHKLAVAIAGGRQAQLMAREIVAKSPTAPENVLWVGVDESAGDRAGAAFNLSPFRGFGRGAAAIREYDYRYPKRLTKKLVEAGPHARETADSIAHVSASEYDCVWLTIGTEVTVLTAGE